MHCTFGSENTVNNEPFHFQWIGYAIFTIAGGIFMFIESGKEHKKDEPKSDGPSEK